MLSTVRKLRRNGDFMKNNIGHTRSKTKSNRFFLGGFYQYNVNPLHKSYSGITGKKEKLKKMTGFI